MADRNHNDDSDCNMLAHYLVHICYTELEGLLQKIGVFYVARGIVKVNSLVISAFFRGADNVEYTCRFLAYNGENKSATTYHLIQIRKYAYNLGTFYFSKQLNTAGKGLIHLKKVHFNDQHTPTTCTKPPNFRPLCNRYSMMPVSIPILLQSLNTKILTPS